MKKWFSGCALVFALGALGVTALVLRAPHASDPSSESAPEASARLATPLEIAETIYDGKLLPGWEDWGWGPHQLGAGPAKIRFSDYGGIILHHAALDVSYGALVFRFRAPRTWPAFLAVTLKGRDVVFPTINVEARHIAELPGDEQEVLIPFSELNPANAVFDRVVFTARVQVGQEPVLIDHIALTKASPGQAKQRSAPLQILCGGATHPINPSIYGGSGAVWDAAQTAQRIGGNPLSRMNWDLNAWNVGSDWFFENQKAPSVRDLLTQARAHGGPSALVVPILGWVAKDAESVGFPKSKFKQQRKFAPDRPEAGDGFRPDGSKLKPGEPSQTSVAAPPELIARWVRAVRDQDHAAGTRSVDTYILDNEPALWDVTHRDVHPAPESYDELLDRTLRYGAAIRRADPEARIAGPAEWGWAAYFDSAKDRDNVGAHPDRRAHGDVPLVPWYLKSLADYERRTGTKILNVLDLHYYPAADNLYGASARTDAEGAALRIRATRSLWDSSYVDESWIKQPIGLIPRMKDWVAANYPGLQLSLGEWSFGAEEHISGGLATAEALGRFGQQGLDSAFYWGGPKAGTPAFWAFRAFRNFDGAGGRFQDISLTTREAEAVSLFASRDAENTRIVAVVVNRDPNSAMRIDVSLDGCGKPASYRVFSYEANSTALSETAHGSLNDSVLRQTLAPYSISVLDVRMEAAPRDR